MLTAPKLGSVMTAETSAERLPSKWVTATGLEPWVISATSPRADAGAERQRGQRLGRGDGCRVGFHDHADLVAVDDDVEVAGIGVRYALTAPASVAALSPALAAAAWSTSTTISGSLPEEVGSMSSDPVDDPRAS